MGSVGKVLNAAIVVSLAEEGKLALDEPVVKYVPDLRIADRRAQQSITLRQLLSMSSGLDLGPYTELGPGAEGLAKYVASLGTLRQAFPPGQGFGYSNAGISGYAAQLVSGESWDTLVRKRIFEPAGLKHAVTLAADLPYQRVSLGYVPAKGGKSASVIRLWYITQSQAPAGSTLAMSAHDLASFGQLFLNGGKTANGTRVLSEKAVNTMMTSTTDVPVAVATFGLGKKVSVPARADGATQSCGVTPAAIAAERRK